MSDIESEFDTILERISTRYVVILFQERYYPDGIGQDITVLYPSELVNYIEEKEGKEIGIEFELLDYLEKKYVNIIQIKLDSYEEDVLLVYKII